MWVFLLATQLGYLLFSNRLKARSYLFTMVRLVLYLLGYEAIIHGYKYRTCDLDAEVHLQEFGCIVKHERHGLSLPHAQRDQGVGRPEDPRNELPPIDLSASEDDDLPIAIIGGAGDPIKNQ